MPLVQRSGISKQRHLIPDSLTHSGGIITAVLSGVSYSHTLSGLTANTLYFLYMRINSGNVILTSSTSVPSVYRVSFPESLLVGAFYANGMSPVAFGSFVNIEGEPSSGIIPYLPTFNSTDSLLAITLNGGSGVVQPSGFYRRSGPYMFANVGVRNGLGGAATGTAGRVSLAMPQNLFRNTAVPEDGAIGHHSGSAQTNAGSGGTYTGLENVNVFTLSGRDYAVIQQSATGGYYQLSNIGAGTAININTQYPIIGWSNTPLKDL